jgi:hypothetical protein
MFLTVKLPQLAQETDMDGEELSFYKQISLETDRHKVTGVQESIQRN